MPSTWSVQTDVINEAREIYSDLPASKALYYFNQIRAEVMRILNLHRTTSTVSLVAGQSEYALDPAAERVSLVEYHRSAAQNDFLALAPTDLSELSAQEVNFRGYSNTEPRRFYLSEGLTGPVIGLVAAPAITTSAGYPKLTIYENTFSALLAGDTFNDDLPNLKVYIYGVAMEWASRFDVDHFDGRQKLYELNLTACQDYIYKKNLNYKTRLVPGWMRTKGVV